MLALVAGQGRLPTLLAEGAEPDRILALDGFPPDTVLPDETFRIEKLGSLIADLVARGVDRVVFAGSIGRPAINPAEIDPVTMPLVPRMMAALQAGDDEALRVVLSFFEEAGISIQGAHQLLPELFPAEGLLTRRAPGDQERRDLERARKVVGLMGPADIGQGLVVKSGQVLAVEGAFGTDWMLETLRNRPDEQGGCFYKAPKPDQDRRIDMPTIGPATIERAAEAKLDGLFVESGGVFVLDVAKCVAVADEAGLFLEVVSV